MKSGKNENVKLSKQNKLLVNLLIVGIVVVFCLLAVLIYINYYTRVKLVLTTVSRYKTGEIKNVTEYQVVDVKKGRNVASLPAPSMEGYTFRGWFKDINYTLPFDYNEQLNEHMQVYGKFELIEYNIELVLDDDVKISSDVTTGIDYTIPYTIEDIVKFPQIDDVIQLEDGTQTSVGDYKTANKKGYVFAGWGLSSTAQATYTDNYPMRAQNLSFFAVWRPINIKLHYMTQSLDFTGDKISQIVGRTTSGGLSYEGQVEEYMSVGTLYNNSVKTIVSPVDSFGNFDFGGWYLDMGFIVPLKTSQLYVKNGYFTMSRESELNVLDDENYYSYSGIDPSYIATIKSYSSSDENNSYITLFAKWTPRKYDISFNLNIPTGELSNYVVTTNMSAILTKGQGGNIRVDDGEYIRKTSAFQGVKLLADSFERGIVHDKNYFKDVIYRESDETGLPLYTILSWNTKKDGSGYGINYDNQAYFDKANFEISNGRITLYAQWKSYYRLNFYYRATNAGIKSIRLATYNVEKDTFNLPTLRDLVTDISQTGVITFNQNQITTNALTSQYSIPLNSTFVGWTDGYNIIAGFTPIYISGFNYAIGSQVNNKQGIYLNSAEKNLYAYFTENDNYFKYDLNLSEGDDVSYIGNVKDAVIDESGESKIYHYVESQTNYVQVTASAEKYYFTKTDGTSDYILWGWTLLDGTEIDGSISQNHIRFNGEYIKYIHNLVDYAGVTKEYKTNVYFDGDIALDTPHYFTKYESSGNRSALYARVTSKILVFKAKWMENVEITFNDGADDVVWQGENSVDDMTMLGAGALLVTMPELPRTKAYRPNYEFVGWSKVDREAQGISYSDFVANNNNTIYYAKNKYQSFPEDTVLYAVWKPIVYSVNIYQLTSSNTTNYNAGTIYIAREKFIENNKKITDEIRLSGSVVSYTLPDSTEQQIRLNTSLVVGKGHVGWTDRLGVDLVKTDTFFKVSVSGDNKSLFAIIPSSSNDYLVGLYPKYEDLKFDVTFRFNGTGVGSGTADHVEKDVKYGVAIRSLLSKFTQPDFMEGYEYAGWLVQGDVEADGTIKDEYLFDIKTGNLTVKSDILLILTGKKQQFDVTFSIKNPSTKTTDFLKTYTKEYGETLGSILSLDEVQEALNKAKNDYWGWNFSTWLVSGGGSSSQQGSVDNTLIDKPQNLSPEFNSAELTLHFKYYSEDSINSDKMEEFKVSNMGLGTLTVGSPYTIDLSAFAVQPGKNDSLLRGFSFDGGTTIFKNGDSLLLSIENIKDYATETITGVGISAVKKYSLDLNAYWSEAVKLTIDLTAYACTDVDIQSELIVAKGEYIYFKDLGNISTLTSNQIVKNELSTFTGKWVDQDGVEYDAYLSSAKILMDKHKTLTPVFETITYTVDYYYRLSDNYYALSGATQSIILDYDTPLKLHTFDSLSNYISQVDSLSDYSCVALYLGRNAYLSADENLKFPFGADFDFKNNSEYKALASASYNFEIYLDLRQLVTITYYMDTTASSSTTVVKVLDGTQYIIGTSDITKTEADIVPTKEGYNFLGWATSTMLNAPEYANGNVITFNQKQFTRLYPVWELKKVTVLYKETTEIESTYSFDCFSTITLLGDTVVDETVLLGWQINGEGTIYAPGSSYTLSTSDMVFVAVREKYYTVYYYNNLGNEITLNERVVTGQEFTPIAFNNTGLVAKEGAEFVDWSFTNTQTQNAYVGGSFTINSRSGNQLVLDKWTITLDNANDYTIKLYAVWEMNKYSAKFSTFNENGIETIKYGNKDNPADYSTAELLWEYSADKVSFVFPSTAQEYVLDGKTYKFDGKWTDGENFYTDAIEIQFTADYVLVPCYRYVVAVTFKVGEIAIYSDDALLSGENYNFNNVSLTTAINEYNASLSDRKLVGWSDGTHYYSHLTSADMGGGAYAWANTKIVSESIFFEAIIEDVITINVFKKVNEDYTFDESNKTIKQGIKGDIIDLTGEIIDGDYVITGWVLMSSDEITYDTAWTGQKQFTLSASLDSTVIYAYPTVDVKVQYAVDNLSNVVKTLYTGFGTPAQNVDHNLNNEGYYLGVWYLGENPYNNEVIVKPTTLLALSLPYYTVQISDPELHINSNSWLRNKLTPESEITLPTTTDVAYDKVGLTLTGWYIKDIDGDFIMDGGERKVFTLGTDLTVQELIDMRASSTYTYGLVPIFSYLLKPLTLVNKYDAISYSISAYDGKTYHTNVTAGYQFYVLKNSDILASNTELKFEAYMLESGQMAKQNYLPVKSVITVTASIKTGYSYTLTSGFYYCIASGSGFDKGAMLNNSNKMGESLFVTANEPSANAISVSFGLVDKYQNNISNLNKAYFEYASTNSYSINKDISAGSIVEFKIISNGYELVRNNDDKVKILNALKQDISDTIDEKDISISTNQNGTIYTISMRVNASSQYYFMIRENEKVSISFELSSDAISDFDQNKLAGGSVSLSVENSSEYQKYHDITLAELLGGYCTEKSITTNKKIKVVANFSSPYYYVTAITLSGTNNDTTVFSNELSEYTVALEPKITISIAERKYQVEYYLDEVLKETSEAVKVTENISLDLKQFDLAEGKIKAGHIVYGKNGSNEWTSIAVVKSDNTYSSIATDLILYADSASEVVTIRVKEISVYQSVNIKLTAETGKANINNQAEVIVQVPINSVITANGINLSVMAGSYSLADDGTIGGVTQTTYSLTLLGTYQFDKWSVGGTTVGTYTVTGTTEINGLVKAGKITANVIVEDKESTTNCILQNLPVATISASGYKFINPQVKSDYGDNQVYYNNTLKDSSVGYDFITGSTFTISYQIASKFSLDSIEIEYLNKKSTGYSDISEFASDCGITITLLDETITISNMIESEIKIIISVTRESYTVSAMLQQTNQSSNALDELYKEYLADGKIFATIGSSPITTTSQLLSTNVYGLTKEFTLSANSEYFVIKRIYINSEDNVIYPNGTSHLATYNASNNTLTMYAGLNGNETIYVEVDFKTIKVVFHKPDMSVFETSEMASTGKTINLNAVFEFNSTLNITTDNVATPNGNIVLNGKKYRFVEWKLYNGDYSSDVSNGIYDTTKLVDLGEYTAKYDLHFVGEWENLYDVVFDGNGSGVTNMPSGVTDLKIDEAVDVSNIPERTGYTFDGWKYVFNGKTYYLNYNSITGKFNNLVNSSGNNIAYNSEAVNGTIVKVSQLITSEQLGSNLANAYKFTLQACWSPKPYLLTINYDNTRCGITQQTYSYITESYTDDTISVNYGDTITPKTETIDSIDHTVLEIKDYLGYVKGRVIVSLLDTYEFRAFTFNGDNLALNSFVTVSGNSTLNVLCWGEKVTHTLNINYDKLYDASSVSGLAYGVGYSTFDSSNNRTDVADVVTLNDNVFESNFEQYGNIYITTSYQASQSLVFGLRHDYKANIEIYLKSYYEINTTTYSFATYIGIATVNNIEFVKYVVSSDDLNEAKTINVTLKERDVKLTCEYVDSSLTSFGEYTIDYYSPVRDDNGIITNYSLNTETVSSNSTTKPLVVMSPIVISYTSDDYVLNGVKLGENNVEEDNGAYRSMIQEGGLSAEYTLTFDYKYIQFNFDIAGSTYATAYFKTANVDNTSNTKLRAFYRLITYGYSSNNVTNQDKIYLFGDETVSNTANSNVVKSNSPFAYYTCGELAEIFVLDVNNNLAKNYNDTFKNVWFENWIIGTNASNNENDLSVSGQNAIVTINAYTSEAIIFTLEAEIEEDAVGGINYSKSASVDYYYSVVSVDSIGTANGYSIVRKLVLKVKDNTNLPQLITVVDNNSYISGTDYSTTCSGKKIYTSGSGGVLAEDYQYSATINICIKQITLNVATNAIENWSKTVTVKPTTTFQNFLVLCDLDINIGIQDNTKSCYWIIVGIFESDEEDAYQIDEGSYTFAEYFEKVIGSGYVNNADIDVFVKYEKVDKIKVSLMGLFTQNGVQVASEMIAEDWYYVKPGSEVAGDYRGWLVEEYAGHANYKQRITLGNVYLRYNLSAQNQFWNTLEERQDGKIDFVYNYWEDIGNSIGNGGLFEINKRNIDYPNQEWYRQYITTNPNDNGTSDSEDDGVYWIQYHYEEIYDELAKNNVNVKVYNDGGSRYTATIINNLFELTGEMTLYGVYATRVKYYCGIVFRGGDIDGFALDIRELITREKNSLIENGQDMSNKVVDYIKIGDEIYTPRDEMYLYFRVTVTQESKEHFGQVQITIYWKDDE